MSNEIIPNRALTKNAISQFILRIDFLPNIEIDFVSIINSLSIYFDRTEKRMLTNFQVNISDGKSEVNKTEDFDYVLVNDTTKMSITFSTHLKAFWIETGNYIDNSTYTKVINQIIETIKILNPTEVYSKRIGMRFINEFKCSNKKTISKILNSNISKSINYMSSQEDISRVISQEEYNFSTSKLRLQYGIPNKFYPAILNNFDLLLDIDSFDDTQQEISIWTQILENLNHVAYTKFIFSLNPKYLLELK
jgi:hypothetical protein